MHTPTGGFPSPTDVLTPVGAQIAASKGLITNVNTPKKTTPSIHKITPMHTPTGGFPSPTDVLTPAGAQIATSKGLITNVNTPKKTTPSIHEITPMHTPTGGFPSPTDVLTPAGAQIATSKGLITPSPTDVLTPVGAQIATSKGLITNVNTPKKTTPSTPITQEINKVNSNISEGYQVRHTLISAPADTEYTINGKVYTRDEAVTYLDKNLGSMESYQSDLWARKNEGYTFITSNKDGTISFGGKRDTSLDFSRGEIGKIERGSEHLSGGNKIIGGILSGVSKFGFGAISTLAATGEILGKPIAKKIYGDKFDSNRHYVSVFDFAFEPLGLSPKGSIDIMLDNPAFLGGGVTTEIGMALAIGQGARLISTPTKTVTQYASRGGQFVKVGTKKIKMVPVSQAFLDASTTTGRSVSDDVIRAAASVSDDLTRGAGLTDDILMGSSKLGGGAADDVIRAAASVSDDLTRGAGLTDDILMGSSKLGGGAADDVIRAAASVSDDLTRGAGLTDDILMGSSKLGGGAADDIIRVTQKGGSSGMIDDMIRVGKEAAGATDDTIKGGFRAKQVIVKGAESVTKGKYYVPRKIYNLSFPSADDLARGSMKAGSTGTKRVLNPLMRARGFTRYTPNKNWVLPSMAPATKEATSKVIVKPTRFLLSSGTDDIAKSSVVGYDAAMKQTGKVIKTGRIIGRRSPRLTQALRLSYGSVSDVGIPGRGGMGISTRSVGGAGGLADDITRATGKTAVNLYNNPILRGGGLIDDITKGLGSATKLAGRTGSRQVAISLQDVARETIKRTATRMPNTMLTGASQLSPAVMAGTVLLNLGSTQAVAKLNNPSRLMPVDRQVSQIPFISPVPPIFEDAIDLAAATTQQQILVRKPAHEQQQQLVPPPLQEPPESNQRLAPVIQVLDTEQLYEVPLAVTPKSVLISPAPNIISPAPNILDPINIPILADSLTPPIPNVFTPIPHTVIETIQTPVTTAAFVPPIPIANPVSRGKPFINIPWWLRSGQGQGGLGGFTPWNRLIENKAVFKHRVGSFWRR